MQLPDQYFIGFAEHAKTRANCVRRHVGAVLVLDNHLISTGYNGTSRGVKNCSEGGCTRCFNSLEYPEGAAYDLCICVHGEENAILQAARHGVAVDGSVLYTTLQPCLSCLKGAINAGIVGVVFDAPFIVPLEQKDDYDRMKNALSFFRQYEAPAAVEDGIRQKISTQN